jgi:photosystem II stability/assembly factor-like uncharacterized protein
MRSLLVFLVAATAAAQSAPQTYPTFTSESLRGVSAVSRQIAWASGTHGTYLRTTDGHTWVPDQVPGAASLDFRAVVAFSADEAFLMSAGPGDQSRIYHTADRGRHWQLQFTNTNPKGFFDSMVFWDPTHGIVLGDPIPDENSKDKDKDTDKLKFELLMTNDGQTWTHIPPSQLPPAIEGEGAFAASNTCVAIIPNSVIPSEARDPGVANASRAADPSAAPPTQPGKSGKAAAHEADPIITMDPRFIRELPAPDPNIWFATGGRAARVFHSPDRGHTWQVFDTPILHGPESAGIFSIAFRDPLHGVVAGGDYKHPDQDGPNLAFTNDAGKTWTLSEIHPLAYFSAAAYDLRKKNPKSQDLDDNQADIRLFLVAPNFIFDFHPPKDPIRISPRKDSDQQFNAVSPYPEGGALVVGPKGTSASIP